MMSPTIQGVRQRDRLGGIVLTAIGGMGFLGMLAMLIALLRTDGLRFPYPDLIMLPICFGIGCLVGLLSMPFVVSLSGSNLHVAVPVIYGVSAGVVVIYACISDSLFYPLDCAIPAFISVSVLSPIGGFILPAAPTPESACCAACGYDLRGTPGSDHKRCPECGAAAS